MTIYDAIVIGAGAMGSAAAYYLSKAGQKVLLLEQFELDHQRGSSYGSSRIIRYSYNDTHYVELAKATYPLWFALQEESGETLYIKTGGIDFGLEGEPTLMETIDAVQSSHIEHEVLAPDEAGERFPQFRFSDGMVIMHQPDSGLLKASLCVMTHLRLAEQHGADIRQHTSVTSIDLHTDSVDVHINGETFSAGKLIVTAGAWARDLLKPAGIALPLQIERAQLVFWQPQTTRPEIYQAPNMPVFIHHRLGDLYKCVYGIPGHDGYGVKAAFHGGPVVARPEDINYTPDADLPGRVCEVIQHTLPEIARGTVIEQKVCLYTMTPDTHFIVDQHPEHAHVAIGAGFSGHGFKFSTMIGKILTDLVLEGRSDQDISLFSVKRFT